MLANKRVVALLGMFAFATSLHAQTPQKTTLTLDDAISLARRNNPDFLAQKNDADVADWNVREAYGQLMPSANASSSFSYQASGTQRFGFLSTSDLGVSSSPSYRASNYQLGVNYSLSGSSLLAPTRAKASRKATNATIEAADFSLVSQITQQYLLVLGAIDGVTLARQELDRAEENRKLAEARVKVGAATPIEQKQAEVEKGRAQVSLLQADNADFDLTTKFDVTDIKWSQDELIKMAVAAHPNLVAARASETASNASVKMAKSAYLPSLSFNTGISGFAREAGLSENALLASTQSNLTAAKNSCEFTNALAAGKVAGYPKACPSDQITSEMRSSILAQNNVFPFNYTRDPWSASLTISLPIFQGFTRELQIQQAKATAEDARYRVHGEELRVKTEVATAYLNATTAAQSVALEKRNTELAADQLKLAQERYRVGIASFLELQDANTSKARADRAYLSAVYTFHTSMAALENAVGRSLK